MAALVQATRLDAQFLLVGDGEPRSAVETEIERLGLSGDVHLAGWALPDEFDIHAMVRRQEREYEPVLG